LKKLAVEDSLINPIYFDVFNLHVINTFF